MVRLALVTSVTCTPPWTPPVRFQSSQLSVVPKSASPRSAAARTPVDVLQDPLDLAAGEVRRRRQPGLVPDDVAAAVAVERAGDAVGAGVLPDDRVVVGPAGPAVPHDGGLALVGDAERGEVGRRTGRWRCSAVCDDGAGALPDLDRVVLHPAGARQDLLVLELVLADLLAGVVEDHEPGARRALVDRGDEVGHVAGPLGSALPDLGTSVAYRRRGVTAGGAGQAGLPVASGARASRTAKSGRTSCSADGGATAERGTTRSQRTRRRCRVPSSSRAANS